MGGDRSSTKVWIANKAFLSGVGVFNSGIEVMYWSLSCETLPAKGFKPSFVPQAS